MLSERSFETYKVSRMVHLTEYTLKQEEWKIVIYQMVEVLDAFDKGILEKVQIDDVNSPKLHRFMRFCIPFFEIGKNLDGVRIEPTLLASMFLWSEVWKPLDNILDGDGSIYETLAEYSQAITRATQFQMLSQGISSHGYNVCEKLFTNIKIETDEAGRAEFDRIHERAAVFETFLSSHNPYSELTTNSFRQYINLIGLSHDVLDLVSDLQSGQSTFVTNEFKKIDVNFTFNKKNMKELINRCEHIYNVQFEKLRSSIGNSCPITMSNLEIESTWAFGTDL